MASKVSGFKALSRNLRTLSQLMERPVSEAARKALAPILAQAKANLRANDSVKEGNLLRGMVIRRKGKRAGEVTLHVVASGKAVGEAHLVEFGTEPHFQPKRGRMHPGAAAKPFLEPAFVTNEKKAVKIFMDELGVAVERQVARMGKRD